MARRALSTLTSSLLGRMQFAFRHGLSAFSSFRNLWQDLGYPVALTPQDYRDRYDRGDIAARIVNAIPEVCDAAPGMLSVLDLPLIPGAALRRRTRL